MDYSTLLNKQQLDAVITTNGPVMVSAGAGSGKTRVLTYRVAYLITECKVKPYNILAITFTNKAANEMKERIARVAEDGELVTVCTFHSLAAKLLRSYASFLPNYDSNFSIYTDQEQTKVYKTIFASLGFNKEDDKLKQDIKNHIYKIKNDGIDIDEYCAIHKFVHCIKYVKQVYDEYQRELIRNNAMDFDDLLINLYKLLKTNEDVRDSIQNRYHYIHVDEFQDTNTLQYEIVKLLSARSRNILIVGDEDQSIYSWRGANIDNIYKFTKDFPEVKIIKLEENYRSTKAVLEKANQLIKNNENRLDKQLYTANSQGDPVEFFASYQESDEADYVIRKILQLHNQGVPFNEMAILMRLNALTRPFEEKLLSYNIPHKIYNGFKFYDRAEIKSTLAYLVAVANPNDDNNIMRIINFPKRGIGEASVNQLMELAISLKCSLKEVIINSRNLDLKSALKNKLEPLAKILREADEKSKEGIYELIKYIEEEAGILNSFDQKDDTEYERWLNVNSLLNSIKEYEENNPNASYVDYLETISLTNQLDEGNTNGGVILATVHSAKGLEFDVVFVVGLEERIFPITRDENDSLEEERRLMYVAITRAKKRLFLTNSKSRFMYGKREMTLPSRFLKEIGMIKDKVLDYTAPYGQYSGYSKPTNFSASFGSPNNKYEKKTNTSYGDSYSNESVKKFDINSIKGLSKGIQKSNVDMAKVKMGTLVNHPKFGTGRIVDLTDFAKNNCVTIDFELFGKKALSLDYAPITFVEE